ncbi:hypothetical protein Sulku_2786 (plasmid) [Sulfuricurvum kujiense DSM 16994]|uniref:SsuA/THI5-like domain-containing protein n=1 Tax=Sulfuricurvum kujiense (strain ATCC BAA-921 / DSM 16994 / JCM 11577 / YK-1) TaxID=709032 RepID=E4U418_SULKY|nr:hypothetical protein [Sulfuricurvum kujiense]ADR35434.1 hypothetical protein Sulku_2786 [Sulfuricurvum kujiense DSM 16994]
MKLVHIFIISALLLMLQGCTKSTNKQKLHIAITRTIATHPMYLAQSFGYFPSKDIAFFETKTLEESSMAFNKGNVDAAVITLKQAVDIYTKKNDFVIVLVLNRYHTTKKNAQNDTYNVLIVRRSYLLHHSQQIKDVIGGWYSALGYMNINMNTIVRGYSKYIGVSEIELRNTLATFNFGGSEENALYLFSEKPSLPIYAKQLENHKESNITQHSLLKAFLPKNTIKELHRYKKWKYKIGQTHI